MPRSTDILHVRIPDELQAWFERFHAEHDYGTKSDTLRVLLTRGLYLEDKPRGRFTEVAFRAAYYNYMAQFHGTVRSTVLGRGMKDLLAGAADEVARRLGLNVVSTGDLDL